MDEINLFQKRMIDNNIDAYIIPSNDYHMSEYTSDFFKSIEYLTGFDGTDTILVITKEKAYLWVDSRYYLQATMQKGDRPIEIFKKEDANTPTIISFLEKYFKNENNKKLGFDSKLLQADLAKSIIEKLPNVTIDSNADIINVVWDNRPEFPFSLIYRLSEYFSGKKYKDKIKAIQEKMSEYGADTHIITSLVDQAWLYNLRGSDINHTPVFFSYTLITSQYTILFVNKKKIDKLIEKYLDDEGILVKDYNAFYDYIKTLKNKKILINLDNTNYEIYSSISTENTIINKMDPSYLLKAIKNKAEIKNIKLAHVKDGVALTKFMYQLKNNYNKKPVTESALADLLEELRKKNKGFIDLSFKTICAFNDHSAMIHYSPTPEIEHTVEGNGFLLIDSGAHYMEGSTDVTRTFAIGKLNDKVKTHFTTVLKSVIALNKAVFLKGTTGLNLDILAREPIWNLGLDYKLKTGHGVGYLLSIHEGPNNFYWKQNDKYKAQEILPGMVTTVEPGIYLDGKYGVRIENELLCVEKESTEFGDFFEFETLTLCPIDLDAIKIAILTKDEKEWLNDYHQKVYDTLSPHLTDVEARWLLEYTKKI